MRQLHVLIGTLLITIVNVGWFPRMSPVQVASLHPSTGGTQFGYINGGGDDGCYKPSTSTIHPAAPLGAVSDGQEQSSC